MVEREKYVDESWKESAAQDKEKLERILKGNKDQASSEKLHTGFQKQEEPEESPVAQSQPSSMNQKESSEDHECGCGHDHGHEPDQGHEHEHDHSHEEDGEEQASQGISFLNHVATLSYQAMIFMGEIPNPMTNMPEENLEQAKFMIDTLAMLRDKTKGNLSQKESDILSTNLYQLQMRYVERSKSVN